jgi:ABC-type transport system involved in cytochrome bd biosynthesis fused ATPase/permease subunit
MSIGDLRVSGEQSEPCRPESLQAGTFAPDSLANQNGRSNVPVTEPSAEVTGSQVVLEVRGLGVTFRKRGSVARVVEDISFKTHSGKTLAIVGESGPGSPSRPWR